MAMRVSRKRNVNAIRVAMKIISTIVALWVGGFAYNVVSEVMNGSCSPFYKGLKLVGLTVESAYCTDLSATNANTITGQNTTSLLAVIGVLAIFWIAFEFIDIRM